MIQRTGPIRTFLQTVTIGIYILFERNIISIKSLAAAPVIILLDDVTFVVLIRKARHTHRMEQTGIDIVCSHFVILIVVGTEQGLSLRIGFESIHQILARLVEVAAAQYLRSGQSHSPIQVTVVSTVVDRILNGPYRLCTVFILRQEVHAIVRFQSVTAFSHDQGIGVFHDQFQVFFVDSGKSIIGSVLAVSFIQISFCKVSSSGCLCRASFFYLYFRQVVVGKLEVVCYLLPLLVIGISGIRQFIVSIRFHVFIVYNNDLLEQLFQHEVSVSAQESRFGNALVLQRIGLFIHLIE